MDNIILSGMLRDFSARHGLLAEPTSHQFERFATYCLLRSDHYDSFDFEKVSTGDCVGVDGLAIAVGGVIVDDPEDVRVLTRGQFEAKFYFCQAKTSSSFDVGDVLKFVNTAKIFFGASQDDVPPELQKPWAIKQLLYERAAKMRQLPTLVLAYVYSGRFDPENRVVAAQIDSGVGDLRAMPYLFSEVNWHVHDGDAIARLYREAQNDTFRDISFQRHVALPAIRGANAAYLGVVGCRDYVQMIEKQDGELNRGLFFENVRDFLGASNPVNEQIATTIENVDERDRFAILNNGVTIVAKKVTPSGDTFRLSQFQVVNGCQTSHVLFNSRRNLTDDMYITVKIIETSDVDLSGKVIATTNSQSLVTKEALATIRPYHRTLEDFFDAMRGAGYPYYYERRPHQYDDRDDIKAHNIVSAPSLIKSFVSVVLEEPQKVHYYYGTLLLEYNRKQASELFADDDYPGLYFAAHHIAARARVAAQDSPAYRNWAYHIALLIKRQIAPELRKGAAMSDKRFFDVLARIDREFANAFKRGLDTIAKLGFRENQNRFPDATKAIIRELGQERLSLAQVGKRQLDGDFTPQVADGIYICIVDRVDAARARVTLRHGPFRIELGVDPTVANALRQGSRYPSELKAGPLH